MGLRIRTNVAALNAQRRLGESTDAVSNSMSKIASGERINKAADDAAGLAISENLRADLRGLSQAKRNALDGVSMVQTAEGGLVETSNMLVRLRELAIQSASDTIGGTERGFLNREYVQLKDEVDRIANATEFNGTRLLTGKVELPEEMINGATSFPMEIQVGKDYFIGSDAADQNNPVNIIRLDFQNINAFTEGEGSLGIGRSNEGTEIATKMGAQLSINTLDSAITKINDYRSYLGAIQNRLGSTINNLGIQIENIGESRSRIRDVDYAEETAKFTQSQILQKAGTAVLAQANQFPNMAMTLLQNL